MTSLGLDAGRCAPQGVRPGIAPAQIIQGKPCFHLVMRRCSSIPGIVLPGTLSLISPIGADGAAA